ncbi:13754_t:CDS:2 [Acaulospora morrowiae]|uniref:13754_t:CDS:1 n=1 Tax=Acaulospora morrowiae TaxID=94023 RepID=A0A9N9G5A3_9GLOM|nr:13754_t:CDS:2 [Acaulospora morrowiae]
MDVINIALKKAINIDIVRPDDKMPFMERDTNQAITRIIRNIGNHIKGSKSKADFDILVSGGAPGIGKTRFGQELFKHLEGSQNDWVPSEWTNLQLKDLYLDFGNGCRLDSYDDELTPTVIIGLRIAYVFFIERKYDMKFITFRDRVWEYRENFKIPNVFECIYDHLIQLNRQLFVFLHIDEFQLIDRWECDAVNERKMPVKQLFKEMINGLASFMLGPPSRIYVQTFLSGTTPQVVISAKESSRVSFGFVNCPQLSFKALLNIANHYAQKYDAEKFACGTYKWMLCRPFLQLLEDTGGLPRALQYIFDVCFEIEVNGKKFFDDIYQQHFNTIFYNVKHHLQERYNIYETIEKNEKLALELLFHSIDAIPVHRKTCLDPSDQDCTIENLERDAHIILNPRNATSSEFTIKMPFFFICLYNDKLKIIDSNLEETLRVQNSMHWQDWELFVAYYETFCTNLLNFEVRLKKLSVRRAQEQFPCLKLTEKDSAKSIPWEKGEDVIVNGVSAKWGNSFRVLEAVQGDRFLSIHQAKYDYNSATYTLKDLFNEHTKNCETSAFNTTKQIFDKLADYRHITIVFTTQPFYEIVPYDDCFVISCNNFEQCFGPVFSSRATFALTKNINPNFSELQRMVECLPGVGDVTAENIIINRPYKSEDDFFKKHSRAKRGKEKHEHENPEKKLKLDFYPFNV